MHISTGLFLLVRYIGVTFLLGNEVLAFYYQHTSTNDSFLRIIVVGHNHVSHPNSSCLNVSFSSSCVSIWFTCMYWHAHTHIHTYVYVYWWCLLRSFLNSSVDNLLILQGQYKSTLVCPVCNKVSVTFDPFMYLSLPLQSTITRAMTVTVFTCDGSALPTPFTVTVPKQGRCRDLIQALSNACSLKPSEKLLLVEVWLHYLYFLF